LRVDVIGLTQTVRDTAPKVIQPLCDTHAVVCVHHPDGDPESLHASTFDLVEVLVDAVDAIVPLYVKRAGVHAVLSAQHLSGAPDADDKLKTGTDLTA
jgi:hypothetical protein